MYTTRDAYKLSFQSFRIVRFHQGTRIVWERTHGWGTLLGGGIKAFRIEWHQESILLFGLIWSGFQQRCAACARHTRHGSRSRRLREVGWGMQASPCTPFDCISAGHGHYNDNCQQDPSHKATSWPVHAFVGIRLTYFSLVQTCMPMAPCSDALLRSEATNGHADMHSRGDKAIWIVFF